MPPAAHLLPCCACPCVRPVHPSCCRAAPARWSTLCITHDDSPSPPTFIPGADKKIFEQAYSAAFGPAMDICYEIYEDGEPHWLDW